MCRKDARLTSKESGQDAVGWMLEERGKKGEWMREIERERETGEKERERK